MYSERVRRLVAELPNSGPLKDATHSAQRENPICGDVTRLELRVEGDEVKECRFGSSGCPGAIAAAASVSQLCAGLSLQQCLALTVEDVLSDLEGLPPHKHHGAGLALEALRHALRSPTPQGRS